MNKKELKEKLIKLLGDKFAKTADYKLLGDKFDKILTSLDEKLTQQIVKKIEIPSEVILSGLKGELSEIISENNENSKKVLEKLTNQIVKAYNSKPNWFKEFDGNVQIKNIPKVEIDHVVKVEQDPATLISIVSTALQGIFQFFGKLSKNTFKVNLPATHYMTPQMVILVDQSLRPIDMKDVGSGTFKQTIVNNSGRGSATVGLKGYGSIGDGQLTVTTAGTRVRMPDVACSRIRIQSHPNNTGDIVIGSANVVADSSTRRGLALFSSQWEEFYVNNLNLLYIDSTVSGDKINYIYEV